MMRALHLGKLVLHVGVLMLIVLVPIGNGEKGRCFEGERMALLELKSYFMSIGTLHHQSPLSTWLTAEDDDGTTTCCEWERVTCNHTTGHVMELSLGDMFEDEELHVLNVSLFLPFEDLQSLNLTYNFFSGWVLDHGFGRLSSLKNLKMLDLGFNMFESKAIFQDLGTLTSLRDLSLSNLGDFLAHNIFVSIETINELSNLKNLEFLDLSGMYISDITKQDCESLSRLKKLEMLLLAGCSGLNKRFIPCLSVLPSLKNLDLSFNNLRGSIPAREISVLDKLETLVLSGNGLKGSPTKKDCQRLSKLRNLTHLDLSMNDFDKDILRCLGDLSSLKYLDIQLVQNVDSLSNQEIARVSNLEVLILRGDSDYYSLNGTLPMEGLSYFRNMEILDLSMNSFVGSISSSIAGLHSLKALSLAGNKLGGSLPTQALCELKKLEELDLSGNNFVGILPLCLRNLMYLRMLDLSKNQFSGRVPPSLITNLTALEYIDLSHNNLEGVFSFISSSAKIRVLNLAHNMMEGSFSSSPLHNFTDLEYLILRNNSFSGVFHLPPGREFNLYGIDISDNLFNGRIQANIGQILPNILYLNFSGNCFQSDNNHLFGSGEMSKLQVLDLSVNKFSGQIFSPNLSLSQLQILDISNNFFSGTIPSSICNMTALVGLAMQSNYYEGHFPPDLLRADKLEFLDISHNFLSGSLPSCMNVIAVRHLHLQNNKFTGRIPHYFRNFSHLVTLDVSDNNLSGHIPSFMGKLSYLRVIFLRGNHFRGFIPNILCQLRSISLMDLSNNSFSGSLPRCLHNINYFSNTAANPGHHDTGPFLASPPQTFRFQAHSYIGIIPGNTKIVEFSVYNMQDKVEFATKHNLNTYAGGSILDYMSGLDLSSNNLTGEIPPEFGMLREIRALNLSHNQLTGPIPKSLSNLTQIESLDLAFNSLSGHIPSQMINLNFLAVFSVAHNNLSGRLPERVKQFATFEGNSYEGNQFQCGLPVVEENCITDGFNNSTPSHQGKSTDESKDDDDKWYEVDRVFFLASFAAAYTVFLFGFGALLFINPNWRRRWFNFIEECMYSSYYFLCDSLQKLSALLHV